MSLLYPTHRSGISLCRYVTGSLYRLLAICILLCILQPVYAQQKKLTGTLKSTAGKPIDHGSILLKNSQGRIILFGTSDIQGKYTLLLPDTLQTAGHYLEVNLLGFAKQQQPLLADKSQYDFLLENNAVSLPDVKVKNTIPVQSLGDTLSYNVASFARKEDRTIGDVIQHMPGLEVSDNGQITYNGKAISNMYVGDDDLLNGRYGLATKTISKDMIKSVNVMLNHQPVKVLKDVKPTDNVAVNLVLKDENSIKVSGQAMLGGGLPEQFDAALNTMMFNKKFKMLNVLKGNNSGIDYRSDFEQLGSNDLMINVGNTRPVALLSAGTAGTPDLPRKNYYLNRSGVLNANNLVNTKSGLQLRSNIQFFLDRSIQDYRISTETYLPGDTIRYNEIQNAVRHPFVINTAFNAMVNKTTYFLNNSLKFNITGDNNASHMDFNGKGFGLNLRERSYDISNDFNWTPMLRNRNIIHLRWYANYYSNPQKLYIDQGLNNDILNNNQPYLAITQQAKTPTFFSHAALAYNLTKHLIKQSYQAGIINEVQQLNSNLDLTQLNGSINPYAGDVGNALQWHRSRIYFNSSYDLRKKNWVVSLSVPIAGQFISYKQKEYQLDERKTQLLINPVLRVNYSLNMEDYIQASYTFNNNVGNISGVYRGAVLTNYRMLYSNDAELQEKTSSGTGISYYYKRSITMLFMNAGIRYNKVTANSVLSSVITNNVQRTVLLPYENDQSNLSADAGISKYLFWLRSTVSVKALASRQYYNQFFNGYKLPFRNDLLNLQFGFDSKLPGSISFAYRLSSSWNTGRQLASHGVQPIGVISKMNRIDQQVSLSNASVRNLFITLKAAHSHSRQAAMMPIGYFFADANLRYKAVKWRTDIELDVSNLFNVQQYETYQLTANMFSASRYDIRGRMAILRATFTL
ncbi:carboxypeptidase-like regulatory domain-containing protein [Sediminibacterium ginsengisoli]|uniref:Outer membrane receptor proteins, mostly Fe transport n=1 Tax=Sediminibacterium ginsengisoli TaxID=413434 RepID=A0A1T4R368_9BACT|nr:carboxypeptidase-like regulatory domain-containing protein [Sediminibacterium ginsengisoli]SKA10068.1 hypothetical protein SAMN04488132_11077 [Sediminibacterium ginsengisoli]